MLDVSEIVAIFIQTRKFFLIINILIVLHMMNIHQDIAVDTERVNKVEMCPQNKTEWQKASRRLNCLDDINNPVNKYHCLPVHDLTTLVEFCYNDTRPRVVKGLCMTYVQQSKAMKGYDCATFDEGCPSVNYFTDEAYKFPSCVKINAVEQCFVAESTCRTSTNASPDLTDVTDPRPNETTISARQQKDKNVFLLISTAAVFLSILVAVTFYVWMKRNVDHQSIRTNTPKADLEGLLTKDSSQPDFDPV
nr:uncharacterized protein LOC117684560 isoform X2 [Crassostrea gigas]